VVTNTDGAVGKKFRRVIVKGRLEDSRIEKWG
jgi:hypothetical protein